MDEQGQVIFSQNKRINKVCAEILKNVTDSLSASKLELVEQICVIGDCLPVLLETFYTHNTLKTNQKYNRLLSQAILRCTGETIMRDEKVAAEIEKRQALTQTLEYENIARKFDYSKIIAEKGYRANIRVDKVFNDKLQGIEGKDGKMIGLFAMNPETKQIEEDVVAGLPVHEVEGKVVLENEISYHIVISE